MTENDAWKRFAESGKITDYLEYCRQRKFFETAEELYPKDDFLKGENKEKAK